MISLRGVLEQGEGEINRTISDDAEEPESKDREPKPPKIRAEDNPWYLLATLYGAPEFDNYELQAKNTVAWNRYFAANLDVKKTNKAYRRKGGTLRRSIRSLGLSLANLLSVFGFRKDFNLSIDDLPAALKILAATQTIVGGAVLFSSALVSAINSG